MKTAEEIINDYYKTYFETDEWQGDLKQYALRFKEMYDKEIKFLRDMKIKEKQNKTEKELAEIALSNVNYCYHEVMIKFEKLLKGV